MEKLPGETDQQWRERTYKIEKEKMEKRKKQMENDKTTDLNYEDRIFFDQVDRLIKEVENNKELTGNKKEEFITCMKNKYTYLNRTSPSMFDKIIDQRYPRKSEIKLLRYLHRKISRGIITKYEASQLFSKYMLRKTFDKINATQNPGSGPQRNNSSISAFNDDSIYFNSDSEDEHTSFLENQK